jgi:nucleoside-diphosphate-sugar epimerase
MRIFLAGASGVIGVQLIPVLRDAGHEVVGMTRSPSKVERLRELGAEPIVCDVYDAEALVDAATKARPDLIMHQLTDLPDSVEQIPEFSQRNGRIRTEGTSNLIQAAQAAGAGRFVAQSIAWRPPGSEESVEAHERMVLDIGGVVLEYGVFYGPGTYGGEKVPDHPRIRVEEAARRTVELMEAPSGVIVVAEERD